MATAAMAFMGWTGRGMPKRMPVRMLAMPEKTGAVGRGMLWVRIRGVKRAVWREMLGI